VSSHSNTDTLNTTNINSMTGRTHFVCVMAMFTLSVMMNVRCWLVMECGNKTVMTSVASAQANILARILSKIGKISRIFDKLDEIKSQ
jgi:hypothetical protein